MIRTRMYIVPLLAACVAACVSCYNLDVRMGMGDGEGVRLSYRIVGKGKPLVVIHDGPGYEKTLMYGGFDGLRSDMTVIYYDQRGCGRSEALSPMTSSTIADNVDDLEALRCYLHLDRFSIAAHGWGAVIALEYARQHQACVESIVLVTPISPFSPETHHEAIVHDLPTEAKQAIAELLSHPSITMLEKRERIMRLVMPSLFHSQEAAKAIDLNRLRYAPDVNVRLGGELRRLDLFPVLSEISVPTLVIVGMHDISTPVRHQMAYADGISTSSAVVFNESGHFPFLEERRFFMSVMKEFLLHRRIPALVYAVGVEK